MTIYANIAIFANISNCTTIFVILIEINAIDRCGRMTTDIRIWGYTFILAFPILAFIRFCIWKIMIRTLVVTCPAVKFIIAFYINTQVLFFNDAKSLIVILTFARIQHTLSFNTYKICIY